MPQIALYDPAEHEPLADRAWDAAVARTFVERTVREVDAAYDRAAPWPVHPEDRDDETDALPLHGVYFGSAGTMWALTALARRYGLELGSDYATGIARVERHYRRHPLETETVVPSYFVGATGIMLARYAITGERAILERIVADTVANRNNPTCEALWGASGTAIALLLLRECAGDSAYDDELRAVQNALWQTWDQRTNLWLQDLYGRKLHLVGAGHGAFGNLVPFVRAPDLLSSEQRALLAERIFALLETYAIRDGAAANWFERTEPREGNRMQWCHGAPGAIMSLAAYPAHDSRIEALLVAGGEGIWRAGPLRKGPALCHGTAGNGFALLRLAQRTGDERWRDRARSFAMHAILQVEAWRARFGMPANSLWTGEMGVAVFVDAVLRDDPEVLTLDVI